MGASRQNDFSDYDEMARLKRLASKNKLAAFNEFIDWQKFRPILERAMKKEPKGPGGRPSFDLLLKFKMLILQRLYNFSDAELEFQVEDRSTFRAFIGLSSGDTVPDEKTIWEFRQKLIESKVLDLLWYEFDKILGAHDLHVNEGRIVDAEIVEAPKRHLTKDEKEKLKEASDDPDWTENEHRKSQVDLEASWTKKHGRSYFGYKNTVNVDSGSKLIRAYAVTTASVHDSDSYDTVLDKERDEGNPVYADKGYAGQKCLTSTVKKCGRGTARILHKAYRDKPLTDEQKEENRLWSKTRARVEHVFGHLKYVMKNTIIRTKGLARAAFSIGLSNLVYNMERFLFLIGQGRRKSTC